MTRSFNYTLLFAALLHMLLVGWLALGKTVTNIPLKPRKVVVKTVRLKDEKPSEIIARAPEPKPAVVPEKISKPKPAPKPKPKPKPEPKPKVKKPTPKPENKPKKEDKNKLNSDQIAKLRKAKDSLSKIGRKEPAPASKKSTACDITHLQVDSADSRYANNLSKALKSLLVLPEYGAVKIKLTLARNGKVKGVEIVDSESSINQKSVEKTLRNAEFSSFGSHFSGENEHTFMIVLSNDI